MLVSKHVDHLRCLGNGECSMVVRRCGIAVRFEEVPELLVGHGEVVCVFVKAPSEFGVEIGQEEA